MKDDEQQLGTFFELRPFNLGVLGENLSLGGSLTRTSAGLVIALRLQGSLHDINLSSMSAMSALAQAGRRHELWRHTCFELFFATPGKAAYWELNLSPSGCWNVYHFAGYRTDMREERKIAPLLCRTAKGADLLSMTCTLNISPFIDDADQLDIGVAGVIEAADGSISYWALDHPGEQPDFHDRRGFLLAVPGVTARSAVVNK